MATRLSLHRLLAAGTSTSRPRVLPAPGALLYSLLALSILCPLATALQYVAGGQCESVCSDDTAGTLLSDVVCLDGEFGHSPGSFFKDCVSCQLNSTSVDEGTQTSDVDWALFNLRYALSNCMFAYPEERVSISSPCQVTCAPLQEAITSNIPNSTNTTEYSANLEFCTTGTFSDTVINNCAFCYSFIPQQLFLGNFLQALHIACRSNPQLGHTFYPDGVAIFNESTIAGPSPAAPKPTGTGGLTGGKLILATVLPIVGGLAILAGVCFGCWHFTRRRRASMAASGRMSRFHDKQAIDYSPMTPRTSPPQQGMWTEPAREMEPISVIPKTAGASVVEVPVQRNSPDTARERWVQHGNDEAQTPLNGSGRTGVTRQDLEATGREVMDPNLHEQYLGGDRPVSGTFHAQDGFAREHTQGGWAQ